MNWDQFLATLRNWATTFGVRLLISIVLLVVSFALINRLARAVAARGEKRHAEGKQKVDETICRTVSYIVKVGLKVLVVLMLVSYLGIDTTAGLGGDAGIGADMQYECLCEKIKKKRMEKKKWSRRIIQVG